MHIALAPTSNVTKKHFFCSIFFAIFCTYREKAEWQSTFVLVQQVNWVVKDLQSLADTLLEQAAIFSTYLGGGTYIYICKYRYGYRYIWIQGGVQVFRLALLVQNLFTIPFRLLCREHFARATGPHDTGRRIDGYQMHRGRIFPFTRWGGGSLGACEMRIIYCK